MNLNEIYHMDCLEGMKQIPDKSIHMILCDLPYGTTSCPWDSLIPLKPLWAQYERVIIDNGAIVLNSTQPFTTALISSNLPLFKYVWIWQKTRVGGIFNAKNMPLKIHEDVCVFSKGTCANGSNNRMVYNPQGLQECSRTAKNSERAGTDTIGNRPCRTGTYEQTATGYPKSILTFKSEAKTVHPTQKPLEMCEYFIKTYSNEGDTVLDNCMGSGTTALACVLSKRNYIGFETEQKFVDIARARITAIPNP